MGYDVKFDSDIGSAVDSGRYHLVEVIKAPDSDFNPPSSKGSENITYDGSRLSLRLTPGNTEDDTYTTLEVSSTPRFNQRILDQHAATGNPQVMIPGRQAVFSGVVFSENFADGKADRDPVTTGVVFQSWRGIEGMGLIPGVRRPRFMAATVMYIGGPGLMPKLAGRSLRRRPFCASVFDFYAGIMWLQPVKGFDPSVPHDIALRWLPNRDVSFVIDRREVAHYFDGKKRFYPLKYMGRQFFDGTNLLGYKYLVADPCHIDAWLNSSVMGTVPGVPNGMRVSQDFELAIEGFAIEPLDGFGDPVVRE